MNYNNFDISSTGINLTLSAYLDSDCGRILFDEQFERFKCDNYLLYSPSYREDKLTNFSNTDIFTLKQAKDEKMGAYLNKLLAFFKGEMSEEMEDGDSDDVIINTVRDFANELDTSDMKSFLRKLRYYGIDYDLHYDFLEVRGYNEYYTIIVKKCDIFAGMKDYLYNLLFESPISCSLTYNGVDFYSTYENNYVWNKEAVLEDFVQQVMLTNHTELFDVALFKEELTKIIPKDLTCI